MGLIQTALNMAGAAAADQWKEYFYCDSISNDILVVRGQKRVSGRSANKGSDNIISKGSVVSVADGQCMIIVDNGKIAELCAVPGEFVYDSSTEPSVFAGNLGDSIIASFKNLGRRFTFGGEPARDQRVYYFNTKELIGNKYGMSVPFRVVDERSNIDIDISLRCFGEYSYHICDPILFYANVCGNVTDAYKRSQIDSQLKSELRTALQPAFAKISEMGIRYSSLLGHTMEIADALNEVLSPKWRKIRGIELVSFGISNAEATEEDKAMLHELQAYGNATGAAAHLVGAQAQAMKDAANNKAGALNGFMGINMASAMGGMNANALFQMSQQQAQQQQAQQAAAQPQQAAAAPANAWTCPACGASATGKFCTECGAKKPEDGWTCPTCGKVNKGKFCSECGAKKPADAPLYKCDKCGWEPEDPAHPPKFCPECGDPFGDEDIK